MRTDIKSEVNIIKNIATNIIIFFESNKRLTNLSLKLKLERLKL